jgi:hypothetical protein
MKRDCESATTQRIEPVNTRHVGHDLTNLPVMMRHDGRSLERPVPERGSWFDGRRRCSAFFLFSLFHWFTMPDEQPLVRQWSLLRILGVRHYGVSVREMAREMNVAEKTIRRDLALFGRLGFPLEKTAGDRGRNTWKLAGGWSQPLLTFTFEEAGARSLRHQPIIVSSRSWSCCRISSRVGGQIEGGGLIWRWLMGADSGSFPFGTCSAIGISPQRHRFISILRIINDPTWS